MLQKMLRPVYLLRISLQKLDCVQAFLHPTDVPIQVALGIEPWRIEPRWWAELFKLLVVSLDIWLTVVKNGPVQAQNQQCLKT